MDEILVAFQGEAGAYSEQAALEHFAQHIIPLPCYSFEEVFSSVTSAKADYGIVPIENSLAGSIHRNYDLMLRHKLSIVGEHHLRISHCLLALKGVKIEDIKRVHSHPQALAQCESSLNNLGVEQIPEADTAGSARLLREHPDQQAAVLASKRAAIVYNLNILAENMEDFSANYTRFLILSRNSPKIDDPERGEYKTSLVFSLNNRPGSLFKALSVFALRDIDLTKIESRPFQGRPWEYLFYIDFAGHALARSCARALEHLQELAPFIRVLGSYPWHRLEYPQNGL